MTLKRECPLSRQRDLREIKIKLEALSGDLEIDLGLTERELRDLKLLS